MNIPYIIIFLGAIVILSHIFTNFFDKIRVPNVLLLMLIGIVIGPATGIVTENDFGKIGPVFSNVVLLLILFESGANLKLNELVKSLLGSSLLTILVFAGTVVIVGVMCHVFLFMDWISSAMLGAILGGTSSAIVIPMIRQIKLNEGSRSLLLMESALSDVLCLIAGLSLFMAMKSGTFDLNGVMKGIGINFIVSITCGIVSGLAWSFIIDKIRRIQNSIFITGAFLFIVYGTTEYLGYNGGIAALMLGITLGNIGSFSPFLSRHFEPINETEKKFYSEIVFVFATYFFVFIGVSMKFSSTVIYILSFTIISLLFLWRYFVVKTIIRSKERRNDRGFIIAIAPKGLVPAILASYPLQMGMPGGEKIQDTAFAVIFLSIVLSSIFVFFIQRRHSITEVEPEIEAPEETEVLINDNLTE